MSIEDIVRIGTVHTVDAGRLKARVKFQDTGIISDWLSVTQHDTAGLKLTPDGLGPHTHNGSVVTFWMPKVGDTVLTIYLPVQNGDGFIVGRIV